MELVWLLLVVLLPVTVALLLLLLWLMRRVSALGRRIEVLERARLPSTRAPAAAAGVAGAASAAQTAPPVPAPLTPTSPAGREQGTGDTAGMPPPLPPRPAAVAAAAQAAPTAQPGSPAARSPAAQSPPPRSAPPAEGPSLLEGLFNRVRGWFTSGNVPIKVGMLVMLAGVAALLKYVSDQGWLSMPVQFRLAGISAAALAGLVFAWRKRHSHRSFALALQGGAIGVLLLSVFAALKNHALIDAGPALAISVVLIAGLAVMAVLQDSRTLAILGVLAGFMAPIWLSDGSGNHVGLFTYYAVLNAGIFAIAWLRPWRLLNLLGFVFTWGIGTLWGVLDYSPDKLASTQPFLLLFFVFYLLLPLLYARKAATAGSARIDGCLLFGTPLIAFSLQAGLLQGRGMPLALCALGLAALYALLARALIKRPRLSVLARGYAILAVGFATLSVPLALSAKATAAVFALEGAGLVWLGFIQQRRLARFTGIGLQLAAACALLLGDFGSWAAGSQAIVNAGFMGALLIALAGLATAWLYRNAGSVRMAAVAYLWALGWWLLNAGLEISQFVAAGSRLHALLLLLGGTAWLAAEVHRRRPALALSLTTLAGLLLAFPVAWLQMELYGQPFAGYGAWAWLLFALLGLRSLFCLRSGSDAQTGLAQLAWWVLWPTLLSLQAWYVGERFGLAEGWVGLLLVLPWLLLICLSLWRWDWLAQPLGQAFAHWRKDLQLLVSAVLGLWWLGALESAGSAAPLPWIVLFNPLDLAQLAVLLLAGHWLWQGQARRVLPARLIAIALAGLLLVTVMTLRAVHHWGGEAWNAGLFATPLAQTSLTVVWSLLGVAGWVLGSRRGQWSLWLAGGIVMGVVLAKLLLVDRSNLGDLLGIGAFIAYGLLCTLVGWLAPAPPRRPSIAGNDEEANT